MTSLSRLDQQPSRNAFVGRERELAELRAGLDDVCAGHGRLFLLSGEPGIGKTRLADEFARLAAAQGTRVVWGRCWEGGGAPAYWPMVQIFRSCLAEADREQRQAVLGAEATPQIARDLAQILPELGAVLSPPIKPPGPHASDPQQARFRLFESAAKLLKNVACIAPLVILVDDLHDADQASLRIMRFIARQTKDARILMIGTYRDSEVRQSRDLGVLVGDLIREGHLIPIAGLSQTEVEQLVESALGHAAKGKMVVELCRATDGNPLFVDGVMRLLAAEKKLDRESLESLAIKTPDGVRESVRRRMAMLSPETVSILSIASVIGNEFEARLLEQVSGTAAEQIVDRMEDASRAGIVIDRATRDSRRQFSHALIRKALYEDLPARRRFELHGLIGEVIEKLIRTICSRIWQHWRITLERQATRKRRSITRLEPATLPIQFLPTRKPEHTGERRWSSWTNKAEATGSAALAYCGGSATSLSPAAERRSRGIAGGVERAEALVAAAQGEFAGADGHFQSAVATFRHYRRPCEEADTLQYWGRAVLAAGDRARAIEKFDAAIEIYRSRGAGTRFVEYVMADKLCAQGAKSTPAEVQATDRGSAQGCIFACGGDYWTVAREGKTWRLKDAKGLHYIAHLLGHPAEEIRALDLAASSGGVGEEVVDIARAEDLARTGGCAGDLGHAGEMLDTQAKASYKRRLRELEDELEEARELRNEERIAKAEDEKEALARELRRAIGLGGRDRRAASSAERARVAVTRAIRLVLERISQQDPDLGRLLSTTIKTGTVCSYVPDDRVPVSWQL